MNKKDSFKASLAELDKVMQERAKDMICFGIVFNIYDYLFNRSSLSEKLIVKIEKHIAKCKECKQ